MAQDSSRSTPAPVPQAAWMLVRVLVLVTGTVMLAGCPAKQTAPTVPVSQVPADDYGDDGDTPREHLIRDFEATVLENYSQLTLGNFAAYRDSLSPDIMVALIGVTPDDLVIGRQPSAAAEDRRLYRNLGPTLLSKNLEIHLSQDGSVGWMFDEMSLRVPYGGRTASIPIRNTTVMVRDFDRWVVVLEHLSYATSIDQLISQALAGELATPHAFNKRYTVEAAPDLLQLVKPLHNARPSQVRGVRNAVSTLILLPDRDRELHGDAAVRAPSLASLFGPGTTVTLTTYRIDAAKNGKVAWMMANLKVSATANDQPIEIGLRATYVFTLGHNGWEVVQMHISAPISEATITRQVFGTR